MFGFSDIRKASDEQLMQLIEKGKSKAFEELYNRYYKKLRNFAYSLTRNMALSEDIVQDVFVKIIEKPEMFVSSRRFNTWVYTVTANSWKNHSRNEANRIKILNIREKSIDWVAPGAIIKKDQDTLAKTIRSVLEELSEKERLIYFLRFNEELSIREISFIAEIPEGTVKSRIHNLLKKFKDPLKEFNYE